MEEEKKDRENTWKGRRAASFPRAAGLKAPCWDSNICAAPHCLLPPLCLCASMSVWMLLSLSHLSLSPTFTFYHRGNWPISLLVVGGSGGGSYASGVFFYIVWFYGCLIAPYCLLVVNKRHSKGRFSPLEKSAFIDIFPVCLTLFLW